MSGDVGDLKASSSPADGPSPKFDLDQNYETPDMGDPSKFKDEVQIASHASVLMRDNRDSEAVRYLVTMGHNYAHQHPHNLERYWQNITQDLTSDECYNMPFDRLQQVAQKDYGIDLSEKTPPTEGMYKAILNPPKGVTDGQKVEPHGTLRVPPLYPGESPQGSPSQSKPRQAPEPPQPTEEVPGKIFPWKT